MIKNEEETQKVFERLCADIWEEAEISQTVSIDSFVTNETVQTAINFIDAIRKSNDLLFPSTVYNNENHIGFIFKTIHGLVFVEICDEGENIHYRLETKYSNHQNYSFEKTVTKKCSESFFIPVNISVHLMKIVINESNEIVEDAVETIKKELSSINEYYYEFDEELNSNISDIIKSIWFSIDELQLQKIQLLNKLEDKEDEV